MNILGSKRSRYAPNRWPQVSLRTMMLIIVALAVVCGIVASHIKEGRDKQVAVNRLRDIGAMLSDPDYYAHYDDFGGRPDRPGLSWLRGITGEDAYLRFDYAILIGPDTTDDALVDLAILSTVDHVEVVNCPITDVGLRHLTKLRGLRYLEIERTNVSLAGAIYVSHDLPECKVICNGAVLRNGVVIEGEFVPTSEY